MFAKEIKPMMEPPNNLNRDDKLKFLMEGYGNDVIRLAYSILKHRQLAEDVAQEVFIKCYKNLDNFRNESSYKTWIFRITINSCKDVKKSWHYRNIVINDFFTNFKKDDAAFEEKPFNEENEFLSHQIMKLPNNFREVIILFYYHDLSIEEIADLLNCKPNTIKSRLHRGRLKLKESFEGKWAINGK